MSNPSPFLRARSLEQKEERRRHLLDTAKELLREIPHVHDLGINELARRAQMTKSNVYRYFESGEAVLLEVLVEEYGLWTDELKAGLAHGGLTKRAATVEHIARTFAAVSVARPLLCRLTSILPSILEHNILEGRMLELKQALLAVRLETAREFHGFMPSVSASAFERFVHQALPLLIGLWPLSHPGAVSAQVLQRPDLAALRYDFQRDLEDGLLMLLRGLLR